jgi:hypothetical protein
MKERACTDVFGADFQPPAMTNQSEWISAVLARMIETERNKRTIVFLEVSLDRSLEAKKTIKGDPSKLTILHNRAL